jgi:hypothetical protein
MGTLNNLKFVCKSTLKVSLHGRRFLRKTMRDSDYFPWPPLADAT